MHNNWGEEIKKNDGVLFLGATNRPWTINEANRRRFEKRLYVPFPEEETRCLFNRELSSTAHTLNESNFRVLANRTELYSCSDINVVAKNCFDHQFDAIENATYFRKVKQLINRTTTGARNHYGRYVGNAKYILILIFQLS